MDGSVGFSGARARRAADYDASQITVLPFGEAVLQRPHMYFGQITESERPLLMLAMTVDSCHHLRPLAPRQVHAEVDGDGGFTVSTSALTLATPSSVQELVHALMWWTDACASTDVTTSGSCDVGMDEHGRRLVAHESLAVRITCDPRLVGDDRTAWWAGWLDRFPDMLARVPQYSPRTAAIGPGETVTLLDRPSGETRTLTATDV